MDAAQLVFDVGDAVVGSGEIWDDPDGVWFDPPHPIPLIFGGGRTRSPKAVRLVGCRPEDIDVDHSCGGELDPGWATIRGEWLGDSIEFASMTPWPLEDRQGGPPARINPPCAPPSGGWPAASDEDLRGFDYRGVLADHVVDKTIFRPRPDSAILVVTTVDVEAVEQQLRHILGDRLCVVRSRWSPRQLEAARADLSAHMRTWGLTHVGFETDDNAQKSISVELFRVLPEIAAWASLYPDGIISLEPGLRPLDGVRAASSRVG